MKHYETIFLKAIISKNFGIAEEALKKLTISHDTDAKTILAALDLAATISLNEPNLSTFLKNLGLFQARFLKEQQK